MGAYEVELTDYWDEVEQLEILIRDRINRNVSGSETLTHIDLVRRRQKVVSETYSDLAEIYQCPDLRVLD